MSFTGEIGVVTIAFILTFAITATIALALMLLGLESPVVFHAGKRPWWTWWMWWRW